MSDSFEKPHWGVAVTTKSGGKIWLYYDHAVGEVKGSPTSRPLLLVTANRILGWLTRNNLTGKLIDLEK